MSIGERRVEREQRAHVTARACEMYVHRPGRLHAVETSTSPSARCRAVHMNLPNKPNESAEKGTNILPAPDNNVATHRQELGRFNELARETVDANLVLWTGTQISRISNFRVSIRCPTCRVLLNTSVGMVSRTSFVLHPFREACMAQESGTIQIDQLKQELQRERFDVHSSNFETANDQLGYESYAQFGPPSSYPRPRSTARRWSQIFRGRAYPPSWSRLKPPQANSCMDVGFSADPFRSRGGGKISNSTLLKGSGPKRIDGTDLRLKTCVSVPLSEESRLASCGTKVWKE
eukprot:5252687-Pleurochrysis_carterae.AAC.1